MSVYFVGSKKPGTQRAVRELVDKYGQASLADATAICAIGGDGTILSALRTARSLGGTPVYGMRLRDSVGALGNAFQIAGLEERLQKAHRISIRRLKLKQRHCGATR